MFRDVEPPWMEVDLKRIAVEGRRAFDDLWIGLQLRLGLVDFRDGLWLPDEERFPW